MLDLYTAAGYESIVTVTQSQLDSAQPYQFYEDGARVSSQPAGSKINQSASTNANGEATYSFRSTEYQLSTAAEPGSFDDLLTTSPTAAQTVMQQLAIELNFKANSSFTVTLGALWPTHATPHHIQPPPLTTSSPRRSTPDRSCSPPFLA